MKYRIILAIMPFLLVFSCTSSTDDIATIDFNKLTSDDVIIRDSYNQLIAKIGAPDDIRWAIFRRYRDDGSFPKDSVLILSYYPEGIMYVLHEDSVRLYRINFTRAQGEITYGSLVFNRSFTMSDALNMFEIGDTNFYHASDYSAMIGLDTSGYLLLLLPEIGFKDDSYTFYFGEDSCLRGINFPIHL
ncbi:MAG: hypothetical protein K6E93_09830 [Bacteroidales bacterium]|jgi:hypothetical protein|nr:hypothetical protein [Bacteroidales bacterium]